MTLNYPYQFWSYSNQSVYSYKRSVKDDHILIEIELPGVEKDTIQLEYVSERGVISIKIDDKNIGEVDPLRLIEANGIEAELELGVLKIKAPVLHNNKVINIR